MTKELGAYVVAEEVAAAIEGGRAVVALESALVTHGLPAPRNVEATRAAQSAIREAGAVPAIVALIDGRLRVGITDGELVSLAARPDALKISRADLAASLVPGRFGGTTVSATMVAARAFGIDVFATGGIGGVHRGGERTFDISADIDELARTPLLVVCSGPKSILDVDLTLELLETRGVPVVAYGTDELPGFLARTSGRPVRLRVESAAEAAEVYRRQRTLGLEAAILLCVPIPEEAAFPRDELDRMVARAAADAEAAGIRGSETTPWLLARIGELSAGRSVAANVALIEQNARIAGAVAVALQG